MGKRKDPHARKKEKQSEKYLKDSFTKAQGKDKK